jgi:thiol-disulfide isomerase/thioredoxin
MPYSPFSRFHFCRVGYRTIWSIAVAALICAAPCIGQDDTSGPSKKADTESHANKDKPPRPASPPAEPAKKTVSTESDSEPCVTGPSTEGPCIDPKKIPRFVEDSPFDDGQPSVVKHERRLWASSWLWAKAPDFVVEKWLTDKPDTKGKYVLIEFWATWCGPCRRSISLLNGLHSKYGDELIVIGVCEENEQAVRTLNERHPQAEKIRFFSAVDTQTRMKNKLNVWGIPHVILLEPDGFVIWEGFPLQPGYELTEEIIEKILAVGRRLRSAEAGATANGNAGQ